MTSLSERIRCAKAVAATHQKYVDAFARHYDRQLYLEQRDEQRSNPTTPNVLNNAIDRLFTAEARAYAEAVGFTKGSAFDACVQQRKAYTTRNIKATPPAPRTSSLRPIAVWYHERRLDIMNNFLVKEWKEQLHKESSIKTYALYVVFVAAKAIMTILTEHPDGENILARFSNSIPDRRLLLSIKQHPDYQPNNIEWYFSEVVTVPAMLGAIEDVLLRYGDVVRTLSALSGEEPDDVELPDHPLWFTPEKISEIELFEQAAMDYLSGEHNRDDISRQYGIGQKRFRSYLRERGLMKPRGGDRYG